MPSRPLSDPILTELLADLLSEEQLPPVDRWFSRRAKANKWTPPRQKVFWDALRRALTRGYGLLSDPSPEACSWRGFRVALRGRAAEWALRADHPTQEILDPLQAGIPGWLKPAFLDRVRRSGWGAPETARFLGHQEVAAPVHVRFRDGPGGDVSKRYRQEGLA